MIKLMFKVKDIKNNFNILSTVRGTETPFVDLSLHAVDLCCTLIAHTHAHTYIHTHHLKISHKQTRKHAHITHTHIYTTRTHTAP